MVNTNLDIRVNPSCSVQMTQVVRFQYPLRHMRSPFQVKSDQYQHCLNQRDDYMDPGERCKSDVFLSYPYLLRPKYCVMASLFHDSSPPSLHCDRTCSRYLYDPAAGVRTLCPSFHGFGLQGYAYDFVWANSVTHEGCLYPDVRLQEKPSNEHDNRDPPAPTFRLLYTWGRDFFNVFFITVLSRPLNFSLLNFLLQYKCLTSLQAIIGGGSGGA